VRGIDTQQRTDINDCLNHPLCAHRLDCQITSRIGRFLSLELGEMTRDISECRGLIGRQLHLRPYLDFLTEATYGSVLVYGELGTGRDFEI